jgi:hypothetical protein
MAEGIGTLRLLDPPAEPTVRKSAEAIVRSEEDSGKTTPDSIFVSSEALGRAVRAMMTGPWRVCAAMTACLQIQQKSPALFVMLCEFVSETYLHHDPCDLSLTKATAVSAEFPEGHTPCPKVARINLQADVPRGSCASPTHTAASHYLLQRCLTFSADPRSVIAASKDRRGGQTSMLQMSGRV